MPTIRCRAVAGAVVAHLRGHRGLTQRDIGKAVGLTTSQWGRIEIGLAPLTVDHLQALAGLLGETLGAILVWTDRVVAYIEENELAEVVADGASASLRAFDIGLVIRKCASYAESASR